MRLPDGRSVFYQPDALNPDGYVLPFHLDTHASSAQKIPSTNHSWAVQHESWAGGRIDRWLPAHRKADGLNGPYVMGYHTRADIPFQFALAEAFTVCDAYHCSVMGPTWPNRLYWMTGMIDPHGRGGGPIIQNKTPDGGCAWTTYAERLEAAGISWKVYQQEEFEYDARNDRLPTVSWAIPTGFQSEHPDFMPADGAAFVASKIDAIAANPGVWAKTAFVLNYDENDGIFDHVAPLVPPAGTPDEFVRDVPIGSGYRVPCIIVSPWTAGGWVCSQPFDHTSVLQLLERITGVRETNITEWRRKTFGDLTSAFRFGDPTAPAPTLPDTGGPLLLAQYESTQLPKPVLPGGGQRPPAQETGPRRRVPGDTA